MSAARDRRLDRKVRQLIARSKRGQEITRSEILAVCPYTSLLAARRFGLTEPTMFVAALGFEPENFSDRLRADILNAMANGETVLLVSNSREVRDHAKAEILLSCATPAGVA